VSFEHIMAYVLMGYVLELKIVINELLVSEINTFCTLNISKPSQIICLN